MALWHVYQLRRVLETAGLRKDGSDEGWCRMSGRDSYEQPGFILVKRCEIYDEELLESVLQQGKLVGVLTEEVFSKAIEDEPKAPPGLHGDADGCGPVGL